MMIETIEHIRPFRFALDPTPSQAQMIVSHCGASRFVYNHMLALVRANLSQRESERSYGISEEDLTPSLNWSAYSLRKTWNTRKDDVAPWWSEVSKEAFANGCANLAAALSNWSASHKGMRKGQKVGFPSFHGRNYRRSVTFTTGSIRPESDRHHITLPRIGTIHTLESTKRLSRLVEQGRARITRATVSWHRGRWVVTLLARVISNGQAVKHPRSNSVVGIDVGVKDWIVAATPDGNEVMRIPVPISVKKADARKRWLQHHHRNKQGSNRTTHQRPSQRWLAAQTDIAKLDYRIAHIRDDVLHKVITRLTHDYETVVVETLNVAGMSARGGAYKKGLNRAIHQAALSRTRTDAAYKTAREGGRLICVDRFYPSSKTCSGCGEVKAKLALSERMYICITCGLRINRDLNAAINLAYIGESAESTSVNGRGATYKTITPSSVVAMGDEASTPIKGVLVRKDEV